jgi:hypothetical protein
MTTGGGSTSGSGSIAGIPVELTTNFTSGSFLQFNGTAWVDTTTTSDILNVANVWTKVQTFTPSTPGPAILVGTAGASFSVNTSTNVVETANNTLDDGSGDVAATGSISPGSAGTAGNAAHIFSGTGTPQGTVTGVAGDFYFNTAGNTATTHIFICTGTTNWTGFA